MVFARRQAKRQGLSDPSIDAIAEALQRVPKTELISLRTVLRMVERGASMEGGSWHLH